jgi:hypothetical protein
VKNLIIVVVVVMGIFCFANLAFANESLYSDVPAKHWAYDAVNKLAKSGIVSGYGDGAFRGDRTITRYEMAQIVANVLTKADQANAEDKALINKLTVEFADELKSLGARVSTLEQKDASGIKFSGELRERYEWTKGDKVVDNDNNPLGINRFRLNMFAPLDKNLFFFGTYQHESPWGSASNDPLLGTTGGTLQQAYVVAKDVFGIDTFIVGRLPMAFAQGLIAQGNGGTDSVAIITGGHKLKSMTTTGKLYIPDFTTYAGINSNYTLFGEELTYTVNDKLTLVGAYGNDADNHRYSDISLGFNYKGIKNIEWTYQYCENSSDWSKQWNDGSEAKAWFTKVKYKGADGLKPGSFGAWASYRKMDPGYDFLGIADDAFDSTVVSRLSPDAYGFFSGDYVKGANNVKGLELGVEYAVARNSVLDLKYFHMKDAKAGDISFNSYVSDVTFKF